MNIGIWMTKELLAHKRESDVGTQVWNLPCLPDGFDETRRGRLFVAVDEHWRGFFRIVPSAAHGEAEGQTPRMIAFDPASWTPVLPERAPSEDQRMGYTLAVPSVRLHANGNGKRQNEDEVGEFLSLLKEEETQE